MAGLSNPDFRPTPLLCAKYLGVDEKEGSRKSNNDECSGPADFAHFSRCCYQVVIKAKLDGPRTDPR